MPRVQNYLERVSTRRRSSSKKRQKFKNMNVEGLGEVSELEIRNRVEDIIDEFKDDLVSFSNRHSTNIVIDLGGLELPLTPGELSRAEKIYLNAVEQGDTSTVKRCLDYHKEFNINPNCVDAIGRDVLRIAIENEHIELLESLLGYTIIELKDSLLHAISEEHLIAVELILQAQAERQHAKKNLKGLLGRVQSSTFTPDITPIILASHCDNYTIIKLLLDRGDRIAKPHDLRCACVTCVQAVRADSLQHSKLRINAFRALTSPSLICLSSKDPILTAFEMSWELRRLGHLENEFKVKDLKRWINLSFMNRRTIRKSEFYWNFNGRKISISTLKLKLSNVFLKKTDYEELAEKCQDFAVGLLAQTRSSMELAVVLNHDTWQGGVGVHVNSAKRLGMVEPEDGGHMKLSRLKLAIKYKQKRFVAHPHCQQLLATLWYDGLPGFRRKSTLSQLTTMATLCCMFPILSMQYIFAPNTQAGNMLKKPFIKFLCHSSAYLVFLGTFNFEFELLSGLLTLVALRIEELLFNNLDERVMMRGPLPTLTEAIIVIFVIGFVFQDMKKIWTWGIRVYVLNRWHLLDFVTNALYVATIGVRVTAWFRVWINDEPISLDRAYWDPYDPILISECLFAAANIFSTLKLIYMFTVSPQLGPLQISLARMINDIMKFFCVYTLVLVAFAFGFNQLYLFYANTRHEQCQNAEFSLDDSEGDVYQYCTTRGQYFTNLWEISQTLYWSAYGLVDLTSMNLEYPHVFTEFVGKLMFGIYSGIAFIVLLNMLIAMMNDSYQRIASQSDVEWKFARSKLWISYFADGNSLPVPFNLCPGLKNIKNIIDSIQLMVKEWGHEKKLSQWSTIRKQVKKVNDREAKYEAVMKELVNRYLMQRQKQGDNQGVTEDDLNEIKGDISAFRHELLDIFRLNGMNVPEHSKKGPTGKRLRRKGSRKSKAGSNKLEGEELDNLDKLRNSPSKMNTKNQNKIKIEEAETSCRPSQPKTEDVLGQCAPNWRKRNSTIEDAIYGEVPIETVKSLIARELDETKTNLGYETENEESSKATKTPESITIVTNVNEMKTSENISSPVGPNPSIKSTFLPKIAPKPKASDKQKLIGDSIDSMEMSPVRTGNIQPPPICPKPKPSVVKQSSSVLVSLEQQRSVSPARNDTQGSRNNSVSPKIIRKHSGIDKSTSGDYV